MDIDPIQRSLSEVTYSQPKAEDSEVLLAIRKLALALAMMAEGIAEIRRTQTAMIARSRRLNRSRPERPKRGTVRS